MAIVCNCCDRITYTFLIASCKNFSTTAKNTWEDSYVTLRLFVIDLQPVFFLHGTFEYCSKPLLVDEQFWDYTTFYILGVIMWESIHYNTQYRIHESLIHESFINPFIYDTTPNHGNPYYNLTGAQQGMDGTGGCWDDYYQILLVILDHSFPA